MSNWGKYVKESFELVHTAEEKLNITLQHDLQAYIVHLFAHFMDKPQINTVPVSIKLMSSINLPITTRKEILKSVGDECLLINAMGWGRMRWPTNTYYVEIGQMAYSTRAFVVMPPEDIYDTLAVEFNTVTKILQQCKIS